MDYKSFVSLVPEFKDVGDFDTSKWKKLVTMLINSARESKVSDELLKMAIITKLNGKALDYALNADVEDCLELVNYVTSQFEGVDMKIELVRSMRSDQNDENAVGFARKLFMAGRKLELKDELICMFIIVGLDNRYSNFLVSKEWKSVESLIQQISILVNTNGAMTTDVDYVKRGRGNNNNYNRNNNNNNKKNMVCWYCNMKGHAMRECFKKKKDETNRKQVSNLNVEEKDDNNNDMVPRDTFGVSCFQVDAKCCTKIQFENGDSMDAILDTGAVVSVMEENLWKSVPGRTERDPVSLQMANGDIQHKKQKKLVKMVVNNEMLQEWFYPITTNDRKVLLGFGFLRKHMDILTSVISSINNISAYSLSKLVSNFQLRFNSQQNVCDLLKDVRFNLKDKSPVYIRPYRYGPIQRNILSKKMDELLDKGYIVDSSSEWGAPAILVPKKKPGDWRIVIDYRELNKKLIHDRFPLPVINELIVDCTGFQFYTVLDIKDGFWRLLLNEKDRKFTAFCTSDGHYEWTRWPMGIKNAPAKYQRVLASLVNKFKDFCRSYIDDVIIFSNSWSDHLAHVNVVLQTLFNHGFEPNWDKCQWGKKKVSFLGYVVSKEGRIVDQEKAKVIDKLKAPHNIKEVRSLLGLCNVVAPFIPGISHTLALLFKAVRNQKGKFIWGKEQANAFLCFKRKMKNMVLLNQPGPGVYHIHTDASLSAAGFTLERIYKGKNTLVDLGGKVFSNSEVNYSIPKKELFAIFLAIKKWKHWIMGSKVIIHTDHIAWKDLNVKHPSGMIMRWLEIITSVDPIVKHIISGKDNIGADALSRLIGSIELESDDLKMLAIEDAHSSDTGGHFNVDKTIAKIQTKYYWKNIRKDVSDFIDKCKVCCEHSNRLVGKAPLKLIRSNQRWNTLGIDLQGPFTLNNGEKKYYIQIIDYFSRFVVPVFVMDKSSDALISGLRQIFWQFGYPSKVISDQGTEIASDIAGRFFEELGITRQMSAADHQQANGMVERSVRTIKNRIIRVLNNMKWKDAVISTISAYNRTPHSSLKVSPFTVFFGDEFHSEVDNQIEKELYHKAEVRQTADDNQKETDERFQTRNKSKWLTFEEEELVMVKNYDSKHPWKGPFHITKKIDSYNFVIHNHRTDKYRRYNIRDLKKYKGDSIVKTKQRQQQQLQQQQQPQQQQQQQQQPLLLEDDIMITKVIDGSGPPLNQQIKKEWSDYKVKHDLMDFSPELVGKRVKVYWPDENQYYPGLVVECCAENEEGTHNILYDDEAAKAEAEGRLNDHDVLISEWLGGPMSEKFIVVEDNTFV